MLALAHYSFKKKNQRWNKPPVSDLLQTEKCWFLFLSRLFLKSLIKSAQSKLILLLILVSYWIYWWSNVCSSLFHVNQCQINKDPDQREDGGLEDLRSDLSASVCFCGCVDKVSLILSLWGRFVWFDSQLLDVRDQAGHVNQLTTTNTGLQSHNLRQKPLFPVCLLHGQQILMLTENLAWLEVHPYKKTFVIQFSCMET